MSDIQSYPLQWPVGHKRTAMPRKSLFGQHTLHECVTEIKRQVNLLGGKNLTVSSNVPLNKSGDPRSDYSKRNIVDKGVAVYFIYNGKQTVLACDKWEVLEHNLWAIAKSIDYMRGLDRHGVSEMLERAFVGQNALPMIATGINPWDILDMYPTTDRESIRIRYLELAKLHQGDDSKMKDLNVARDLAYSECN